MKITNAMYLISSTKVKKARRALTEALPHFEQSEELITETLPYAWWGGWVPWRCRNWATRWTGALSEWRSSPAWSASGE